MNNTSLPKLTHLLAITDQFGIWQHHENGRILSDEGYALDDSARGLIVYLLYDNSEKAQICLNYLENSIKEDNLVGFFYADKSIRTYPSSEDALGLTYWALAYCINKNTFTEKVKAILNKINTSLVTNSTFIRTSSYGLIAESLLHNKSVAESSVKKIISKFSAEKKWFEDSLTYANAIIPYSLLVYMEEFSNEDAQIKTVIEQSIETLEKYCRIGKIPAPVGNREWQPIGSQTRDPYGQQPIDAAFMVLLLVKAYKLFNNEQYRTAAREWYDWFYGNNIMKQSLINDEDACADGIDESGISKNYGAESTIVFLWAAWEYKNL